MSFDAPRFAIGQPVPRREDPRLVRGGGRYADDLSAPGQLFAHVLRSPHAAGRIRSIDVTAARSAAGVRAVLTGADIEEAGLEPIRCGLPLESHDGTKLRNPPRPAIAVERVTHVGEPLAFVIADSPALARDAAELIGFEIETSDVVTDPFQALAEGAPLVHPSLGSNLALDWTAGDAKETEALLARAAHVTRLRIVNNRVAVAALEPRAALAVPEEAGRLTLFMPSQGVYGLRQQFERLMRLEKDSLRLVTRDVGGSFGMKGATFPEYLCLLQAARLLGRPVKWTDDRSGSFVSDHAGRDAVFDAELALDEEGDFLAVRVLATANIGAYCGPFGPGVPTLVVRSNIAGAYRTRAFALRTRCVLTHCTPTSAYRGAGRPEGVMIMERLIDRAARELGRDPIELRRQNLIPKDAMPFRAMNGHHYDSGDFGRVLDAARARADLDGFARRRAESEGRGRLRGLGLTTYLEVTAGTGREMGGIDFGEDGRITLTTGTLDYGQGHCTPFAQVLAARLGVSAEMVELVQGDSDRLLYGGGTGGSRSIMASGTAIVRAAEKVIEKGRAAAAEHFEAAPVDIGFAIENGAGMFKIAGTDRSITLKELARARPGTLDVALVADTPPAAFPNGCHIAEVEVDPQTGKVTLQRYTVVDDFGTLINPMLVEGQVHGGITQGIGQALFEHLLYDESGQPVAGSFMDYCLPRADDLPPYEVGFEPSPATTNDLGVKGCGEAGVSGSLPTILNAVLDALAPLGVHDLDMPATPEKVWQAIRTARAEAA